MSTASLSDRLVYTSKGDYYDRDTGYYYPSYQEAVWDIRRRDEVSNDPYYDPQDQYDYATDPLQHIYDHNLRMAHKAIGALDVTVECLQGTPFLNQLSKDIARTTISNLVAVADRGGKHVPSSKRLLDLGKDAARKWNVRRKAVQWGWGNSRIAAYLCVNAQGVEKREWVLTQGRYRALNLGLDYADKVYEDWVDRQKYRHTVLFRLGWSSEHKDTEPAHMIDSWLRGNLIHSKDLGHYCDVKDVAHLVHRLRAYMRHIRIAIPFKLEPLSYLADL